MTNGKRDRYRPNVEQLEGRSLPSSLMTMPVQSPLQMTRSMPAAGIQIQAQNPQAPQGIIAILIG